VGANVGVTVGVTVGVVVEVTVGVVVGVAVVLEVGFTVGRAVGEIVAKVHTWNLVSHESVMKHGSPLLTKYSTPSWPKKLHSALLLVLHVTVPKQGYCVQEPLEQEIVLQLSPMPFTLWS
jgi:hypothetical protein